MTAYEWRACVQDTGDLSCDWEGPFDSRAEAEAILPDLMAIAPEYDEGWVERRPKTVWERVVDPEPKGSCPACLGARSVQVGGPDEFGNIDYDDCQLCAGAA